MKLTNLQLRSLKLMLRQKNRQLTVTDFIREAWQKYLLIVGIVALAIVASILNHWTSAAIFLGGYLTGLVERDFQWCRNQVRVLPLTKEIINWERVEQLVQENEQPSQ